MKLYDVRFGLDHTYYCAKHSANCSAVASYLDDGAAIIIELHVGGDTGGELKMVEASDLEAAELEFGDPPF